MVKYNFQCVSHTQLVLYRHIVPYADKSRSQQVCLCQGVSLQQCWLALVLCSQTFGWSVSQARCCTGGYKKHSNYQTRSIAQRETFEGENFCEFRGFGLFAKVLYAKFGDVVSFGGTSERSAKVFSAKIVFSTNS